MEGSQREATALLTLLVLGVARTSASLPKELIVTAAGTAMTRVALVLAKDGIVPTLPLWPPATRSASTMRSSAEPPTRPRSFVGAVHQTLHQAV